MELFQADGRVAILQLGYLQVEEWGADKMPYWDLLEVPWWQIGAQKLGY